MLYHNPKRAFRIPFTARVREMIHAFVATRHRRLMAFAMLSKHLSGHIGRYGAGLFTGRGLHTDSVAGAPPEWLRNDIGLPPTRPRHPEGRSLRWK